MKSLFIALFMLTSLFSFAHEGEEGVEVKNAPRYGGRVAAVEEAGHGHEKAHKEGEGEHHDEPSYMSELLISDENKMRLYFYDHDMKDISLAAFPTEIIVTSTSRRGREVKNVKLLKAKKYYIGDMPTLKRKPFDLKIDFTVKSEHFELEFMGMD